jgi:hypothetical protein
MTRHPFAALWLTFAFCLCARAAMAQAEYLPSLPPENNDEWVLSESCSVHCFERDDRGQCQILMIFCGEEWPREWLCADGPKQ